ncbi:Ig-like domain-containing protein [Mangrovibacter sp. SLW1]
MAYDIKGNKSNRGTTDILVTAPQIANGELELVADNATDDGVAINTVSARLTDISNNPVSGVTVHFSADNEAAVVTPLVVTDDNGIATTNLTSTTAGVTNVIAEVNGNTRTVAATFVAGSDSAVIQDGDLVMIVDNAIADNTDANTVQAKVTNSSGNAVPDVTVNFSTAITGVTITAASVTTDSDGLAKTNITSTRDGSGPITAEINGNSQSVNATFVPDNSSATLASDSLVVTANNAAADGSDTNAVEVMVVDESNNPLPNVKVNFATTNGAAITPSVVTDATGKAATTLTNTMAGTASVTAEVNGSSQTVDTTFVADSTTATVTLTSDKDEQPADGSSAVAVTATVKDVNGNLLTGEKITFTTTGEALFSGDVTTFTAATNSDGQVVADITDTVVENVMVTATPESNASGSANKSLTFAEVPTSPFPATTKILVNGETFGVSDGFPKTGFRNAQFQFAVGGDVANNSNYTWSVEEGSWLRVDPNTGTVTFTNQEAML